MATTNPGDQRQTEARSGGKILRRRRIAPKTTPYDRPISSSPPQIVNENPNWLSSATRILASGAGKLLSTVYSPDFSSESSSSSSSDDDFGEIGPDDIYQEDEIPNNKDMTSLEMVRSLSTENKTVSVKKDTTSGVIERLLMRETFSRKEGDGLIRIIESRIHPMPSLEREQNGRSTDRPPLSSSPVLEAKIWLEEKKLKSATKSELHGICSLNSAMLPYYTASEVGSPVDVARSYMRSRPRWASISPNSVEVQSPLPGMSGLFGEELPHSDGSYLSSSKLKRDRLDDGAWSISKEIRKVRAKASEDLLGSVSASKLEWSPFDSEHKRRPTFLISDSEKTGKEMPRDGLPTSVISNSEQSQDIETSVPSIQGNKDMASKKENGSKNSLTTNGIPSSEPSLKNVLDTVSHQNHSEGQQSSGINASVHGGETCELMTEVSVEVPITNHTTGTGSTIPAIVQALKTEAELGKIKNKRVTRSQVSQE